MENQTKEYSQSWAITSLVTAISSGFLFFVPYFAIFLAGFAIYAHYKQSKIKSNALSTAGLIIAILSVILNGFILLFILFIAMMM